MTVLVTGGAGYIGAHTVRALCERGRDVVVLDTLETGSRHAVSGVPLVVGDTRDGALVHRTIAEHAVDAVIHFAGYKNPGESVARPERYFRNNLVATLALLEAMIDADVGRFVFSSSCSVYGTPASLPVAEDAPLHPESPYGQSKCMVEQALDWYDRCRSLRYASLRYFNAAGASADATIGEDWTVTQNLIPLVMKATLGKRPPVQVFGTDYPTRDGTAVRDYVHVVDLADAHVRALERLEAGHESLTVNLGTGTGSTVQEVIDAVGRASGRDVPVEYAARRPGDPAAVYADNARAAVLLGWRPTAGLEEIVRSAWRWHSTHPLGYAA
jgi:UDP-glucose-4-epimerase GalE